MCSNEYPSSSTCSTTIAYNKHGRTDVSCYLHEAPLNRSGVLRILDQFLPAYRISYLEPYAEPPMAVAFATL